jgi:hypothetical protein
MDFDIEKARERQRVFGNSENIRLEKSEIKKGSKSVKPCHIRPVARRVGNKKPQLITVGVSYLVEAAGIEKYL